MAETTYTLWLKAQKAGDKRGFVTYQKDLNAFFTGLNAVKDDSALRNQYLNRVSHLKG